MAMNPKALPGDAATTALNSEMINEVLDVMVQLTSEGMTMIVATNEWEFAPKAADRVVLMADDEIVHERKPEESFTNPRSDRARDALSKLFMT